MFDGEGIISLDGSVESGGAADGNKAGVVDERVTDDDDVELMTSSVDETGETLEANGRGGVGGRSDRRGG